MRLFFVENEIMFFFLGKCLPKPTLDLCSCAQISTSYPTKRKMLRVSFLQPKLPLRPKLGVIWIFWDLRVL
jgi:hypothetical protein